MPEPDFSSKVVDEILHKLMPMINEIEPRWREIGQSLGLELSQFNIADEEGDLLRQVITKWVDKSLGINMWPPLLDALVAAGGEDGASNNIISELRDNYAHVVHQADDDESDDSEDEHQPHYQADDNSVNGRCWCLSFNGWRDFKLTRIDPAVTVLLLAVVVYGLLHIREMDELDKYMAEHQLESDKWQALSARPINILVTGKTGTGKSALINGLIGKKIAEEGDNLKPQTSEVEKFQRTVNGVPMKVFDSPGLQDGTEKEAEYIKDMEKNCREVDLILYTIKMTDARIHEDDVRAMRKLTVAFGEKFWNRTMLVLTFANRVQVPAAPGEHNYKENYDNFEKKLQLWKGRLPDVLHNTLGIPSDIASEIPIVPAGYYKVRDLPGCRFWFSQFWKTALKRMTEVSEDRARFMLEYSKDRWQRVYESSPDDFDETIDNQPIYAQPERKGWLNWS